MYKTKTNNRYLSIEHYPIRWADCEGVFPMDDHKDAVDLIMLLDCLHLNAELICLKFKAGKFQKTFGYGVYIPEIDLLLKGIKVEALCRQILYHTTIESYNSKIESLIKTAK